MDRACRTHPMKAAPLLVAGVVDDAPPRGPERHASKPAPGVPSSGVEPADPEDPNAHWAIPALERLRKLPPPGCYGPRDDVDAPEAALSVYGGISQLRSGCRSVHRPEPVLPPEEFSGEELKRWHIRLAESRHMFGSGN
jgi:hypothetical protein